MGAVDKQETRKDAKGDDAAVGCPDTSRESSVGPGTSWIREVGGGAAHDGSHAPVSRLQLLKFTFTQCLLCGVSLCPWNIFPLPAGTILSFVSRGQRKNGFRFLALVMWACPSPAPAPVSHAVASSFPCHTPQKVL